MITIMKKRSLLSAAVLTAVMTFSLILSGCGTGDPLTRVAKLLDDTNRNITLTDVRNKVPAAAEEYSVSEINDMLIILNDKYNNQLGDAEYYVQICDSLSKTDIYQLYDLISDTESSDIDDADNISEADETNTTDDNESHDENVENTNSHPRNRNGGLSFNLLIIIIAAVAGVLIVAGIVVIIIVKNKNTQNKRESKKNNDNDGDYDDDDDDDDDYDDDDE